MKQYYDQVLRDAEPEGFAQWFDHWYGKEKDFGNSDLVNEYLSERRFALVGWIAATNQGIRMDDEKFSEKITGDRSQKFNERWGLDT